MKTYNSLTLEDLKIGDKASISKKVTKEDVLLFAQVTGDQNPAHTDEEYAKNSIFKTTIAHGMLGAGLISAVLGMKLPGAGTIYLGQDLKFLAPIHIDDEITAVVELLEIIPKKSFSICKLSTKVFNQNEVLLIDGTASVIPPKKG